MMAIIPIPALSDNYIWLFREGLGVARETYGASGGDGGILRT